MSAKPEANSPRFLAWLYSTRSQQPVLASLCGIEQEIGASLRSGIDHHVAHTRLEWWRAECARCAAGNPVHPLTRELRIQVQRLAPGGEANSALGGLSGFADMATWDLAGATFERRKELTAYCRRWAAAMIVPVASEFAGAPGRAAADLGQPRARDSSMASDASDDIIAQGDWAEFGTALCELEMLG